MPINLTSLVAGCVAAILRGTMIFCNYFLPYKETLDSRYKRYGTIRVPRHILIIILGLDGATLFFSETIPDLTFIFS